MTWPTVTVAGVGAAIFMCLALGCTATQPQDGNLIVRAETDKSFDDVIFELDFAITERNFRITGRNTIGKGLRDRGYENFPDVEVIHFCNLEYAREVLLIDPGYVAQMPCRITVHTVADTTVISLILLPENHPDERVNAFAHRMNAILHEIVDFVLEEDSEANS
ncbi:MAG: DUF302 domain-containing protein [Gammaproteobacteria bacterium]|jgi:uncharacterized protein (DUF302 family)|nr:DUF302 domain-containing protein [Gammaproteobacteria bacterium]